MCDGHLPAMQRFPGRGQVLGSSVSTPAQVRSPVLSGGRRPKPSSNQTDLHARLLDPGPAVSSPEMQQNLSTTPPHNRLIMQRFCRVILQMFDSLSTKTLLLEIRPIPALIMSLLLNMLINHRVNFWIELAHVDCQYSP